MTQEDKELLLKDLCARLPYKVIVQSTFYCCDGTIWKHENETLTPNLLNYPIHRYKPYLFPLSSMTEEQKEEYCQLQQKIIYNSKGVVSKDITEYINWCYKNHLDINDLIPQGLAIDATGLNIY